MHDTWLAQLPGWRAPARHGMRVAARLSGVEPAAGTRPEPLWRRSARAAALGTTLGIGASGTLLLSVWQVQEAFVRNRADQQAEARQLFGEVSKGLQAIDAACPVVPEVLVSQVSLLLDLRGSPAMRPLERAGLERLTARLADQCVRPLTPGPTCATAPGGTFTDLCSLVLKPATENTALNYWHPGISPAPPRQWTSTRPRPHCRAPARPRATARPARCPGASSSAPCFRWRASAPANRGR